MTVIPLDRLTELLAAKLDERPELVLLVYAPFGIIRGKLIRKDNSSESISDSDHPFLLLNEVTVEHYSNHIPTASYAELSINMKDVQGWALVE